MTKGTSRKNYYEINRNDSAEVRLKKFWYNKLINKGFKDIEFLGNDGELNNSYFRILDPATRELTLDNNSRTRLSMRCIKCGEFIYTKEYKSMRPDSRRIIYEMSLGTSNAEIAKKLHMSEITVKNKRHRLNMIIDKFDYFNQLEFDETAEQLDIMCGIENAVDNDKTLPVSLVGFPWENREE